jgi:hypothetical protein
MQKFRIINQSSSILFSTTDETIFQNYLKKYFQESENYRIILLDNQNPTEYATEVYKKSLYVGNKPAVPPACFFFSPPKYNSLVCSKKIDEYNSDELNAFKNAVNMHRKAGFDIIVTSNEYPTHLNKITEGKKSFIYANIGINSVANDDHLFDELEIIVNEKCIAILHNVVKKKGETYDIVMVNSEFLQK